MSLLNEDRWRQNLKSEYNDRWMFKTSMLVFGRVQLILWVFYRDGFLRIVVWIGENRCLHFADGSIIAWSAFFRSAGNRWEFALNSFMWIYVKTRGLIISISDRSLRVDLFEKKSKFTHIYLLEYSYADLFSWLVEFYELFILEHFTAKLSHIHTYRFYSVTDS